MHALPLSKHEWALLYFNAIYIFGFSAYYIASRNFEFLWYAVVLLFFFFFIAGTLRKTDFTIPILWGLSFWGFAHMAGGGIIIHGDVLYQLQLIHIFDGSGEYFILKFDQLLHFFGFFVTTYVVYHLLARYLNRAGKKSGLILFFAAMASMGLSVLNELVEFGAFLALDKTGVGGYGNTLLDLTFNTLGATVAALAIFLKQKNIRLAKKYKKSIFIWRKIRRVKWKNLEKLICRHIKELYNGSERK